jgi:hypothetical protein
MPADMDAALFTTARAPGEGSRNDKTERKRMSNTGKGFVLMHKEEYPN